MVQLYGDTTAYRRNRREETGEKLFIEMANRHFNSYLIVVHFNPASTNLYFGILNFVTITKPTASTT